MSKNLEDLLEKAFASPEFIDALAYQVAQMYRDKLQDEFGNEVTKALGEHVAKTVEQYAKDWELDENVKRRISSVYRSIDKDELMKVIIGTDWRAL